MPIYEYKCPKCNKVFEEWVRSHDTGPQDCPACGVSAPHIVSNTSFVLKGGGWYVTEYGNRKNADSHEASAPAASTGESAAAASPAPQGDAAPSAAPAASPSVSAASAASPAPATPAASGSSASAA